MMRRGRDRRRFVNRIQQRGQNEQIEYATAQDVADGDIRRPDKHHGADPSDQFRQRSHRGHQHHPDQGAAQPSFLGDNVAIAGQSRSRQNDDQRTDHKLDP